MRFVSVLLLMLVTAVGTTAGQDAKPAFSWPTPDGWRSETIPFPLDFAPTIPHKGVEMLRFPPGFATASAPDFWAYDFVWWIDDATLTAPVFEKETAEYFRGLCTAIGGKKFTFDPKRFAAHLTASGAHDFSDRKSVV